MELNGIRLDHSLHNADELFWVDVAVQFFPPKIGTRSRSRRVQWVNKSLGNVGHDDTAAAMRWLRSHMQISAKGESDSQHFLELHRVKQSA